MSGFAQGVKVTAALESVGIVPAGWFWRWHPGMKGGVFPEHLDISGDFETDILDFGTIPQGDVNGDYCECQLETRWRDQRTGRFARAPGTAVAASVTSIMEPLPHQHFNPVDWVANWTTSLSRSLVSEMLGQMTPTETTVNVTVPDLPITVNVDVQVPPIEVPPASVPDVIVRVDPTPVYVSPVVKSADPAPVTVNVEAPQVSIEPAQITVETPAPLVTVETPAITVDAPEVTVTPTINVPAAKVPPRQPRQIRLLHDDAGNLIGAEEV